MCVLGNCNSEKILGKIECGWPNITKEQCLERDCCYVNKLNDSKVNNNRANCFVNPHLGEYSMQMPFHKWTIHFVYETFLVLFRSFFGSVEVSFTW